MREMLFKNWNWLFENTNQTPPKYLVFNTFDENFFSFFFFSQQFIIFLYIKSIQKFSYDFEKCQKYL